MVLLHKIAKRGYVVWQTRLRASKWRAGWQNVANEPITAPQRLGRQPDRGRSGLPAVVPDLMALTSQRPDGLACRHGDDRHANHASAPGRTGSAHVPSCADAASAGFVRASAFPNHVLGSGINLPQEQAALPYYAPPPPCAEPVVR